MSARERWIKIFGSKKKKTKTKPKVKPPPEKKIPPHLLKPVARWRRGAGVWNIVVVVEGYDEEFEYICDGKLTEPFARQLARVQIAKGLKESYKLAHVQSAERMS